MVNHQTIVQVPVTPDNDEGLRALRRLAGAGGLLNPSFRPYSRQLLTYGEVIDDREPHFMEVLDRLSERGFIERVFFERITRCPDCAAPHLCARDVCSTCGSANIDTIELLHHFRCGFVADVRTFVEEPDGLRCPKCRKIASDRGTDHDSPGPMFRCRACSNTFQVPETGTVCLGCGARFHGTEHERLRAEDIWAYRMLPAGRAALLRGDLGGTEPESPFEDGGPVYRRPAFTMLVDHEAARARRFGTSFALAAIAVDDSGTSIDHAETARLVLSACDETARIGRYDAGTLALLLPGVDRRRLRVLAKRLPETIRRAFMPLEVPGKHVADLLGHAVGLARHDL